MREMFLQAHQRNDVASKITIMEMSFFSVFQPNIDGYRIIEYSINEMNYLIFL